LLIRPDPVQHLDFEAVPIDPCRLDAVGDLLDEVDVVGPEPEADRTPAAVEQETHRQPDEVGIDLPAIPERDRLGLVVGALDEADRRIERAKSRDVRRCAAQVRLETDAGLRLDRANCLVELDRRVRVVAALHVDPEVRTGGGRSLGEADQVVETELAIQVEPELCRLDRDLAVDPGRLDLIDDVEIVRGDLVGFLDPLEVLAESCVHRADPCGLEREGSGERVFERLAGHEPANGAVHERQAGQPLPQPPIAGSPQEDAAHRILHRHVGQGFREADPHARSGSFRMIGDRRARIAFR
jgi:hypothetical protein